MGDRGDRGSATVLAIGLIGVLLSLALAALALGAAMIASHRARASADLAALAGASVLIQGQPLDSACTAAAAVVERNAGRLTGCRAVGASLEVVVQVQPAIPRLGLAAARARAGPPEGE